MNSKWLTYGIVVAFIAVGILLLGNAAQLFGVPKLDQYLSPYDVRGMAIVHAQVPYTLNFQQQNVCIEALNRGILIGKLRQDVEAELPFEKLMIYRFGQPDIDLPLVDLSDHSLIFQASEWNPNGFLVEVSGGDMWATLQKAYAP